MISQVFDKIFRIELPIPFPLEGMNVFFVDEPPRRLIDTGIRRSKEKWGTSFNC
jgi:hypothetical protein